MSANLDADGASGDTALTVGDIRRRAMPAPRSTDPKVPVAFMSYAHHDDGAGRRLTRFHARLEQELRSQTGTVVEIFKDSDDIQLGEQWRSRLDLGLAASTFLLPIITPSFFTSPYCQSELETFRRHEDALGRGDLILPVYYIDCEDFLATTSDTAATAAAHMVLERQYSDWRDLRRLAPSHQRVEEAREELAKQIRAAMVRVAGPREPSDVERDRSDPVVAAPLAAPSVDTTPSAATSVDTTRSGVEATRSAGVGVGVETITRDALPACCVRIDVGGSPAGSGFFVAPGIVVTCYHVLRLGDLSSEEAGARISVVSPTGDTYEVLDTREWSPTEEDDLAILRVQPADGHALVLLDTGLRERDELHSFGFPEEHEHGTSVPLSAERWEKDKMDRWLRIADGQVGRGMSGSPVLNLRTGAVCAILKRDRDGGRALGGCAVSVRRLFGLNPTLSSANFRYHMTYKPVWFDHLPPVEQKLLLAQRTSGPAALPDHVLVISVDQCEDEWEVIATVQRREGNDTWTPGPPLGPITVDLNSVRALVARVFRDWASRDAGTDAVPGVPGRVEPGEQIRLLGEILSRALLTGRIGDMFNDLIDDLEHGWVEVALHFADVDDSDFREFVQLPWEHLYLPPRASRGDVYFAREPKLAFVRSLRSEPETREPSQGKLSLLVVAIMPEHEEQPADDAATDTEVKEIVAGLERLGTDLSECLDVKVITSPGFSGLGEEVASGSYDAVHYIGFGRFEAGRDRVALSMSAQGPSDYRDASDFASCVEGSGMPRVVVLQICRGSETVPADLAAFGPALLMKKGSQAVVASQYPVSSKLTQKFNAALYSALAGGAPLEMAAQSARKKVWSIDSEGRAFLSPAVFVRHPGGLRLTPERSETGLRSRAGTLAGHA
jgi:hypothetical protein